MLTARGITAGWVPGRPVVRDVDLDIAPGEVVGLQGPSGCGKSTLARVIALLHRPDAGTVSVDGRAVTGYRYATPRDLRVKVGILFQQPRLSIDPRLSMRDVIAEPLLAQRRQAGLHDRVTDTAATVGLTGELLTRRAHAVSDGQLQRACLARALITRPRYLICDEMTTMLDASTTAALITALMDYCTAESAGVLAISHDDALLRHWAGYVLKLNGSGTLEPAGCEKARQAG